jgi:CubicO group peptidase (beta-lactamase class C family)
VRGLGLIIAIGGAIATQAAAAPAADVSQARAKHLAAYVAAVNSGDGAAFRANDAADALRSGVPAPALLGYFRNQHRVTGGVVFVGAHTGAGGEVEVALRDRLFGTLHGLRVNFDATDRVEDFGPNPAPAWARTAAAPLSDDAVAAKADELVARGCKAEVFSGTVLVARGDRVLVQEACGEASKRYHVPNDLETRINLGSANKMFTETAIMQLVEAGKIKLSDPVSTYVDASWLAPEVASRITVGQLMAHTSGLDGDFLSELMPRSRTLFRDLADYKPLVRDAKLTSEPGAKFAYNNTGVLLLGVVIEKASGESYDDYVRRHIFEPAGMTRTASYAMDDPVPDLAMGYRFDPSSPYGWRENTFAHVLRGGPAGGGFSTVGDLFKFSRALQSGVLISKADLQWMATAGLSPDYGQGGFEIATSSAGRIIGHSGIFQGISVRFHLYPDSGWTMVALSNVDGGGYALGDALDDVIGQSVADKSVVAKAQP